MKISERCYVIYGLTTIPPWMVNSGFIVGDNKTLIIDCGGNYLSAKTIYGYAKIAKPENELIAINTEPHFDHMGGNCFFREMGINIYGHHKINRHEDELTATKKEYQCSFTSEVRKQHNEEEVTFYNTQLTNPNLQISENTQIDLGGIAAEIILTPGHTKMNLSIFVNSDKVLYCGDVLVNGYIPNLEDGGVDDWKEWLISIEKIENISPEIIVSGHGEVLTGEKIETEIVRIQSILDKAIKSGNPPT